MRARAEQHSREVMGKLKNKLQQVRSATGSVFSDERYLEDAEEALEEGGGGAGFDGGPSGGFAEIRGGAGAQGLSGAGDEKETKALLASRHAAERLEGLKRVTALYSVGRDASAYFPDVVKLVVDGSFACKKLVYLYLARYAHTRPDEALLSINAFQKELGATNPLLRALALRAMTSIRLPIVAHLQSLAVKRCAVDPCPHVRRAAVHALPRICALDPEQRSLAVEIISVALNDGEPGVLGSVLGIFVEVCPDRLDLLHPHFRKLCRVLADLDEWAQTSALTLLTRYCRIYFVAPPGFADFSADDELDDWQGYSHGTAFGSGLGGDASNVTGGGDADDAGSFTRAAEVAAQNFYSDEGESSDDDGADKHRSDEADSPRASAGDAAVVQQHGAGRDGQDDEQMVSSQNGQKTLQTIDPDHRLLLRCAAALVHSTSTGVAVALAALFVNTAPARETREAIRPLMAAMHSSRESQYVSLANIATLASQRPGVFRGHIKRFLIKSSDAAFVRALKIDVLTHLADESNIKGLLGELEAYTRDPDRVFVTAVVRALGVIADRIPAVAADCASALVRMCVHAPDDVAREAALNAVALVARDPQQRAGDAEALLRAYPHMTSSGARATVLWMGGEFSTLGDDVALATLEMLRLAAKSYARADPPESSGVRSAVLGLAAKLSLLQRSAGINVDRPEVKLLLEYVLNLARWDTDVDIRDKARMLRGLTLDGKLDGLKVGAPADSEDPLEPEEGTAAAEAMLLVRKKPPVLAAPAPDRSAWTMGSLSHLMCHRAPGYEPLPDWAEVGSDPSLRDPPVVQTAAAAAASIDANGETETGSEYSYTDSDYSYTGSSSYTDSSDDYTDEESVDGSSVDGANGDANAGVADSAGVSEIMADLNVADEDGPEPEPEPEPEVPNSSSRRPLLHHTDGRGLAVDYAFSWEPSQRGGRHVRVLLFMINTTASTLGPVVVAIGDSEVQVKKVTPNRPAITIADVEFAFALDALPATITVSGVAGGAKHTARASLRPVAGALLRPQNVGEDVFAGARDAMLEGGAESAKKVLLDPDLANAISVRDILRTCANVREVRVDEHAGVVEAAGEALDGSGKYFLLVTVSSSGDAKVSAVGDDDGFAAALCAQVQAAMQAANDDD